MACGNMLRDVAGRPNKPHQNMRHGDDSETLGDDSKPTYALRHMERYGGSMAANLNSTTGSLEGPARLGLW